MSLDETLYEDVAHPACDQYVRFINAVVSQVLFLPLVVMLWFVTDLTSCPHGSSVSIWT